jgi:hypothetical protein
MRQPTFGLQKQQQIEVEEQEYQPDKIGNAVIEGGERCSNECEDKQTSKCQENDEEGGEDDDDDEGDDEELKDDEELPEYEEEEEEQQNGRSLGKITEKEYRYLMTVQSVEELNEIRSKVWKIN